MKKQNCWEFKNCGRELGGRNAHEYGPCPASTESKFNGLHGGVNGGRCCWFLPRTLCSSKVQVPFSQRFANCLACDFYKSVKEEEFSKYRSARALTGTYTQVL